VITALGAVFFPPLANTLIFVLMALVLLVRPAGLFGTAERG
jgi:branched-chain amino acid transport system permease protein